MKIRTGFVSNSSSTSFTIYGKEIDDVTSFFDEIYDKLPADLLQKMEKFDDYDKMEELAEFLGKEFECHSLEYYNYLGVNWFNLGEDETPRQFKEKIDNTFKEKLGIDANELDMHEYCGYDG